MPNIVDLKKVRAMRNKAAAAASKKHYRYVPKRGSIFSGSFRQRSAAAIQIIIFFALFTWFMQTCSR